MFDETAPESPIKEDSIPINLDHLEGDAKLFVEKLIESTILETQEEVMAFCQIMSDAVDQEDPRAYVGTETGKLTTLHQVDIYHWPGTFGIKTSAIELAMLFKKQLEKKNVPDDKVALIEEIFFNLRYSFGKYRNLNPISLLAAKSNLEADKAEAVEQYEKEFEVYESYLKIANFIGEHGGLTKEFYEQNHTLINTFIILWKKYKAVGGGYNFESEAEYDQAPTAEMIARFPEDGIYEDKNIFNRNRGQSQDGLFLHSQEGILWQREHGADGMLSFMRIYHQSHRTNLIVHDIDIKDFYSALRSYPQEIKPALLEIDFPEGAMSAEEYKSRIDAFNQNFAPEMRIEIGELVEHWGSSGHDGYYIDQENLSSINVKPQLIVRGNHAEVCELLAKGIKERQFSIRQNMSDLKWMTFIVVPPKYERPFEVKALFPSNGEDIPAEEESVVEMEGELAQELLSMVLEEFK